jgi:hypothetical protein
MTAHNLERTTMNNEAKHTPGPWHVEQGTNGCCKTWQVHHTSQLRDKVVTDCGAVVNKNYQGSTENYIGESVNYEHEANARRIVACVNACERAQLSTEGLEKRGLADVVMLELIKADDQREENEMLKEQRNTAERRLDQRGLELSAAIKQRDELLTAAQRLLVGLSGEPTAECDWYEGLTNDAAEELRTAIAKATGGA